MTPSDFVVAATTGFPIYAFIPLNFGMTRLIPRLDSGNGPLDMQNTVMIGVYISSIVALFTFIPIFLFLRRHRRVSARTVALYEEGQRHFGASRLNEAEASITEAFSLAAKTRFLRAKVDVAEFLLNFAIIEEKLGKAETAKKLLNLAEDYSGYSYSSLERKEIHRRIGFHQDFCANLRTEPSEEEEPKLVYPPLPRGIMKTVFCALVVLSQNLRPVTLGLNVFLLIAVLTFVISAAVAMLRSSEPSWVIAITIIASAISLLLFWAILLVMRLRRRSTVGGSKPATSAAIPR